MDTKKCLVITPAERIIQIQLPYDELNNEKLEENKTIKKMILTPDAQKITGLYIKKIKIDFDYKDYALWMIYVNCDNKDEEKYRELITLGPNKYATYINKKHEIFGYAVIYDENIDLKREDYAVLKRMGERMVHHTPEFKYEKDVITKEDRENVMKTYIEFLRENKYLSEELIEMAIPEMIEKYVEQGEIYYNPMYSQVIGIDAPLLVNLYHGANQEKHKLKSYEEYEEKRKKKKLL